MALRFFYLFFSLLIIYDAERSLAETPSLPSLPPPPPVSIDLPALPAPPAAEEETISTPEAAQKPTTQTAPTDKKNPITDITDITEADIEEKSADSKLAPSSSIPMPPIVSFIGNTLVHRYYPQHAELSDNSDSLTMIPMDALEKIKQPASSGAGSADVALPLPEAKKAPVVATNDVPPVPSLPALPSVPSLPLPEKADKAPAPIDTVPVKSSPPPLPTPALPLAAPSKAEEEKTVKLIAPLADQEIDNIDNIDHYNDFDSEDADKDEPFSIYNQDDVKDPVAERRKAALRESKKFIENTRRNNLLAQLVADASEAEESEAELALNLGNLGPETKEESFERTIKERIAKRKDDIKKTQQRAALNYRTSLPPAAIYNNHYSAQNRHLPKPRYLSQYQQYTFNAIDASDVSALRTYLAIGKFIEARDASGNTPLIYATEKNKPAIVQYLLARGANVQAKNTDKASALHIAAYTGMQGITELLLDAGALVDAQDTQGYSPLMLAAMYRKDEAAKLLLMRGANKSLRDKYGRTASTIAAETGNTRLANDLKEPVIAPRSNFPAGYYKTIQSKEVSSVKKKKTAKKSTKKQTKKKAPVKKAAAKKSVKKTAPSSL